MDLPTSETLPIVVSTLAASVSLLAGLVGLFGWVRGRLRRAPHRTVTLCPDDDWLASNDVSNIAATQNLLVSNKPGVTNRTDAFIWLGAFLDDQVEALARFGHDRRDLAGHHIYVPHFGAGPSQRHLAKPESWLVQAAIAAENLRSYLRDTRCTRVYVIGFSAGADLAVCIGPYLANSGLDTHIVALDANTSQRTTFLTSAVQPAAA